MLRPQFAVRRRGQRYDCGEVDALVARIVATVEHRSNPTVTVAELRSAAFRTPFFGAGYPVQEVDDYLVEAERWLPDRPVARSTAASRVQRESPLFTPVRLREGYDVSQVDEFVDRIMATVNGQPVARPVTVREIRNVQFNPVRLSEGYDVAEVDDFLDRAITWLSE